MERQAKAEKVFFRPKNLKVKLIDFGGATYANDHHTQVINTR